MTVITTLSFMGRTEEALNLYQEALGCEVSYLLRFRDSPDQSFSTDGSEDLIFHATFKIEGTEFKASDIGHEKAENSPNFEGFAFVIQPESIEQGQKMFEALSKGGEMVVPLSKSKFTGWYGIVKDKFGINWKINIPHEG